MCTGISLEQWRAAVGVMAARAKVRHGKKLTQSATRKRGKNITTTTQGRRSKLCKASRSKVNGKKSTLSNYRKYNKATKHNVIPSKSMKQDVKTEQKIIKRKERVYSFLWQKLLYALLILFDFFELNFVQHTIRGYLRLSTRPAAVSDRTKHVTMNELRKQGPRQLAVGELGVSGSSLLAVLSFLLVLVQILLMLCGDVEPNPGPTQITVDQIDCAVEVLQPICYKWRDLGGALHISQQALSRRCSPQDGLKAVLQEWMQSEDSIPTWDTLRDAVAAIGERDMSQTINQRYVIVSQQKDDTSDGGTATTQQVITKSSNEVLTIDDLSDLLDLLSSVKHKCVYIGLKLGVNDQTIRSITKQQTDHLDQLYEILRHRLTQLPHLTMYNIVHALESRSVEENAVASEICSRYALSSASPQVSTEPPLVPFSTTAQSTPTPGPSTGAAATEAASSRPQVELGASSLLNSRQAANVPVQTPYQIYSQPSIPPTNTTYQNYAGQQPPYRYTTLPPHIPQLTPYQGVGWGIQTPYRALSPIPLQQSPYLPPYLHSSAPLHPSVDQRTAGVTPSTTPLNISRDSQMQSNIFHQSFSQDQHRTSSCNYIIPHIGQAPPYPHGMTTHDHQGQASHQQVSQGQSQSPNISDNISQKSNNTSKGDSHSDTPSAKRPRLEIPMDQFISYIKQTYRQSLVERRLNVIKWPPTPSKIFINLARIDWRTVVTRNEADEFTRAMVEDGNVDVIMKKKTPIEFNDITQDLPDTALEKIILVEGAPGVGKSTFAWEFCRKWERGEIAQQYKLVLLLRLRDERVSKAQSLRDLLYHPSHEVADAVEKDVIETFGDKCLIILEGFDELPHTSRTESSIFLQLINGLLLPLATIVVTSRPWATSALLDMCHHNLFKHIEILGFTESQVEEYVKSVFIEEKNPVKDAMKEKDIEDTMAYIATYPQIKACMYIPLNAAIVVSVYKESKAGRCILPKTLTELYYALTQTLLLRYLRGHPVHKKIRNVQSFEEDLPQEVYEQLLTVSEVAYKGICTNWGDSVQLIYSDLPPTFETLGLMQSVSQMYVTQGVNMSHNFLHLTVQEFLAALHISKMSPEAQLKHFKKHKEGRFRVLLRFLAGLTKLANISWEDRKALLEKLGRYVEQDKTYTQMESDMSVSVHPLNWLFETQSSDVIKTWLKDKTLDFKFQRQMSSLEYYSTGYCIAHSSANWVLTVREHIEETFLKMLCAGTSSAKEADFKIGLRVLVHMAPERLELLLTNWGPHIQELQLKLRDGNVILENLSALQVLHLELHRKKTFELTTSLLPQSLESLTIEAGSGNNLLELKSWVANRKLSSLKDLKFSSGKEDVESLTKALAGNDSLPLKRLTIPTLNISDTAADSLALFIQKCATLEFVSWEEDRITLITACGLRAMVNAEQRYSWLPPAATGYSHHCVVNCIEDGTDFDHIWQHHIFHGTFTCHNIGDEGACSFASSLIRNSTVEGLSFSCNQTHPTLAKMLHYDRCQMPTKKVSDTGATALAQALHHNSTLRELNLSSNSITDAGATALAQALHHNSTLRELSLSSNSIADAGATALTQALHHNSTLWVLNLSSNSITDVGATALAQALHRSSTLQELNLSNNRQGMCSLSGDEESMMDKEKQRQLLNEALEEGYISTGLDVLLFIGPAGSGKTHYRHLCFGLPPPEVRDSTGLSEHPVRTMSFVRGAVEQIPQNRETTDSTCLQWLEVPAEEFMELIIEAISEGRVEKVADSAMMAKLANRATEGLPTIDEERGLNTTESMSSAQKESAVKDRCDAPELDHFTSKKKVFFENKKPSSARVHYESNFSQELLRKLKSSTASQTKRGKLLDVDWVYIVDSGGQPQFREMLPILVKMATACVLTLKLNVSLGKLNEVECVEKGKELCKPYLSVLTNEHIVKHCSQIVDSQTKDCKLFVVGTHQDLEHECQSETRADKNKRLLKLLQTQLGTNLEVYKTGDPVEVIFPVNSKTPTERDYKVVEQFKRAVHNLATSKEKVDIPLHWFLLELLLHQLSTNSGILSFEGCKEEAIHHLKISEEAFPTAIKFLAKRLGTVLYFPKVLPNVIFTPQALMNILSKIVKIRHLLKNNQPLPVECQGHSGEWLKFQRSGIMKKTLLQTAQFQDFFSDIFTSTDFLIVMTKLLIVAEMPEDAFFFPSVLEELSPEEVQKKVAKSRECLEPLVLRCSDSSVVGNIKENWLSVGSFTSLVAQLLNVDRWTLCTDEMQNPSCLYRNCIQFNLPDNQPGIVTLVDQFRHMEVYLQVDAKTAKRISKIVVPTLYSVLNEVHTNLLHSENRIEVAFLCPEHDGHHTASIAPSGRGQWKWTCKQDRITSRKVTGKQTSWLGVHVHTYIQDNSKELSEIQKPWLEDHDEEEVSSPPVKDKRGKRGADIATRKRKSSGGEDIPKPKRVKHSRSEHQPNKKRRKKWCYHVEEDSASSNQTSASSDETQSSTSTGLEDSCQVTRLKKGKRRADRTAEKGKSRRGEDISKSRRRKQLKSVHESHRKGKRVYHEEEEDSASSDQPSTSSVEAQSSTSTELEKISNTLVRGERSKGRTDGAKKRNSKRKKDIPKSKRRKQSRGVYESRKKEKRRGYRGEEDSVSSDEILSSTSSELAMDDMVTVRRYLLDLDKKQVHTLGLILGLHNRTVSNKYDGSSKNEYLDDILGAWFRKQDDVEKKGTPSWTALVSSLEDRQLQQNGIAKKIREERLCQ